MPISSTVDFSHLRGAIGGGMAVQDVVAKKWQEVTGRPLVEGYGLSETSPLLWLIHSMEPKDSVRSDYRPQAPRCIVSMTMGTRLLR